MASLKTILGRLLYARRDGLRRGTSLAAIGLAVATSLHAAEPQEKAKADPKAVPAVPEPRAQDVVLAKFLRETAGKLFDQLDGDHNQELSLEERTKMPKAAGVEIGRLTQKGYFSSPEVRIPPEETPLPPEAHNKSSWSPAEFERQFLAEVWSTHNRLKAAGERKQAAQQSLQQRKDRVIRKKEIAKEEEENRKREDAQREKDAAEARERKEKRKRERQR